MAKQGRPSNLSDRLKAEAARRLAQGDSYSKVSKDLDIPKSTLSRHFSGQVPKLQKVAAALATVELEMDVMTVSEQVSVRSIADQLKGIQSNLTQAAASNARTSAHFARIAEGMAQRVTVESAPEDMRSSVAAVEASNRAGSMGVALITAKAPTIEPLPTAKRPNLKNLSMEQLQALDAIHDALDAD